MQHSYLFSRWSRPLASAVVAACLVGGARTRAAELPTVVQVLQLSQEAVATPDEAGEKLATAVALRPDMPRLLTRLAAVQAAAEQFPQALETLERLAAMGVGLTEREREELEPVKNRPEFASVFRQLAENGRVFGEGELAFALREVTGLIEGIAWRQSSGEFFFGDVHHRTVWVRSREGNLRRFAGEGDELLGVFGLAIDEARGALWAATGAVREMRGYSADQEGSAALVEIDLGTGAVRRTLTVPPGDGQTKHILGSVAVASDGAVFAADRGVPVLWHLPPNGDALARFAESPEFFSLQGIAATREAILVADRLNGLLRVDVNDQSVARVALPSDTTLIGVNGLILAPGTRLLALQGGTLPIRVLQLELNASFDEVTSTTVLEAGHLTLAAPSNGTIGPGGDLVFIGNPGWSRFASGQPTAPRSVPIFKTKLKLTR